MCHTFTVHYDGCGCDVGRRQESDDCGGSCTGDDVEYNEDLDQSVAGYCDDHMPQEPTPPTSSDNEGSEE